MQLTPSFLSPPFQFRSVSTAPNFTIFSYIVSV
jgi:hypothetical protein